MTRFAVIPFARIAIQSPWRGTACGPQCDQIPNLASRNHSGYWYSLNDSSEAENLSGSVFFVWAELDMIKARTSIPDNPSVLNSLVFISLDL